MKATRREYLLAVSGAVATTAGCQRFQSESPGSLVVKNRHDLPHVVKLKVVKYAPNGGAQLGSETGQVPIEPGATRRYADYFDPSFGYWITGSVPSSKPVRVPYGRKGIKTTENLVFFEITKDGTLNGGVRSV